MSQKERKENLPDDEYATEIARLEALPQKLWAAWFRPGSQFKKPQRVVFNMDSESWWHKGGNDEVQQPGLHAWEGAFGGSMPELVSFASEDKEEVQRYIDFSNLLMAATIERLGV